MKRTHLASQWCVDTLFTWQNFGIFHSATVNSGTLMAQYGVFPIRDFCETQCFLFLQRVRRHCEARFAQNSGATSGCGGVARTCENQLRRTSDRILLTGRLPLNQASPVLSSIQFPH
jgi:hypothetical protein